MKEINVVCGAICQNDLFFIAKRGKGVDEYFWEFPGGKIEPHESKEEAIIRELKEELNVDVHVKQLICDFDDIRETHILHLTAFLCEIISGTPCLSVHTEMKWVKANELYDYHFQKADRILLDKINESSY